MTAPDVAFFDVNETLLDMSALRPSFTEIFGSPEPMSEWFARMLHGSLVANHVGHYRDFGLIGAESLMVLAQKRGIDVDPGRAAAVVEEMRTLPPHPDVKPALARLREAGIRLVAVTNGSSSTVAGQLTTAGLADSFERGISVDALRRFKPSPEVYLHACAVSGVEIDRALMVAAHDWDIIGARSVGMRGAFLARTGVVWGMPDQPPEIVAFDLGGAVDQILGG